MKAFPIIGRPKVLEVFNAITNLYNSDQIKILEAAQRATIASANQFTASPTAVIADQLEHVKRLVEPIHGNTGRNLLILILEELIDDLKANSAYGVTEADFYLLSGFEMSKQVKVQLKSDNKWWYDWTVDTEYGEEIISVSIRDKANSPSDIVPSYIIQYLQQGVDAFQKQQHLTALALISIALEGTLRDALEVKGYTYSHGAQLTDVYEIQEMHVIAASSGFLVQFPDPKPKIESMFLSEAGKFSPERVRIKRLQVNGRWKLEIRDVDYLMEYWSSNSIVTSGTGIVNIGGLGTALSVARGPASILTNAILPSDLDELFQIVRNNLIHLSGSSISNPISSLGNITLEDFSKDRSKVLDAIYSISRVVQDLYTKKANGTL